MSRIINTTSLLTATVCGLALAAPASAQQRDDRDYEDRNYQRRDDGQRQSSDQYQGDQRFGDRYQDQQRWEDDRMQRGEYNERQEYGQQQSWRDDAQSRDRGYSQDQRRQDPSGQPAGLGVSVVNAERGVRVRQVARNSPADQAGIRVGDEILAVNERRVSSSDQLASAIRQQQPGSRVDLRVNRNGEQRTLTASLETRREALDFQRGGMAESERYFRGSPPPWGGDQLRDHVDALERQLRQMEREIQDLRAMLDSDPTRGRFGDTARRSGQSGGREFDRSSDLQRSQQSRDGEYRNQN